MNVSIAQVASDLGTTTVGIQTAITLYTLVMAAFMLTGGKIGARIGRRKAFSIGLVVYAAGSFTTAISPQPGRAALRLVAPRRPRGRADPPAIVALVACNFGKDRRAAAYGMVPAAAAVIAVTVGPILGGAVTTFGSWRYVFAGEVVVAAVTWSSPARSPTRRSTASGASTSRVPPSARSGWPDRPRGAAGLHVGLRAAEGRWDLDPRSLADGLPRGCGCARRVALRAPRASARRARRSSPRGPGPGQDPPGPRGSARLQFQYFVQAGLFFIVPVYLSMRAA